MLKTLNNKLFTSKYIHLSHEKQAALITENVITYLIGTLGTPSPVAYTFIGIAGVDTRDKFRRQSVKKNELSLVI